MVFRINYIGRYEIYMYIYILTVWLAVCLDSDTHVNSKIKAPRKFVVVPFIFKIEELGKFRALKLQKLQIIRKK